MLTTGKEGFRHALEHGKSSIPTNPTIKPLTLLHKLEKRANQPLRTQLSKSGTRRQTDTMTHPHTILKSSASNQRLRRKKKKLKTSSIGNIESIAGTDE